MRSKQRSLARFKGKYFCRSIGVDRSASGRLAEKKVLLGTDERAARVANARLEFWHADESGEYDNQGSRYRGHQHADAQGRYRLETIVPAEYPGRARHIHVKVQARGRRVLTNARGRSASSARVTVFWPGRRPVVSRRPNVSMNAVRSSAPTYRMPYSPAGAVNRPLPDVAK